MNIQSLLGVGVPGHGMRSCGCVGPQNGDPVCPCRMPAYREQQAGARALDLLRRLVSKPRVRVPAGRRLV